MMTLGEAKAIAGSLSYPSKMPGTSYGLPAIACKAGSEIAKIAGTVCAACFAVKDFYRTPNAKMAAAHRLDSVGHPRWIEAIVRLLLNEHRKDRIKVDLGAVGVRLQKRGGERYRFNAPGFHRWHDSGDLQSIEHFANICAVARQTPKIRHWLPTQELRFVDRYLKDGGAIPDNLCVRVSGVFIDRVTPRSWPTISTVYTKTPPAGAYVCPAPTQGHECKNCRACWDHKVAHVAYHLH